VLDVILDHVSGEAGAKVNWRIPRTVLEAILHLAPVDNSRRRKSIAFILDLKPRIRAAEAYQRDYLIMECILAMTRMGEPIPDGLDTTRRAIRASQQWSVTHLQS